MISRAPTVCLCKMAALLLMVCLSPNSLEAKRSDQVQIDFSTMMETCDVAESAGVEVFPVDTRKNEHVKLVWKLRTSNYPQLCTQDLVYAADGRVLWAIEPATGDVKWKKRLDAPWVLIDSRYSNGSLYAVATKYPRASGTPESRLLAIEATTGHVRWDKEFPVSRADSLGICRYGLSFTDENGVVRLLSIKDGREQWKYESGKAGPFPAAPIQVSDRIYAPVGWDSNDTLDLSLCIIEPDSGELFNTISDIWSCDAAGSKILLNYGGKKIASVDVATGKMGWGLPVRSGYFGRRVSVQGEIALVDEGIEDRRTLTAIDIKTGHRSWQTDIRPEYWIEGVGFGDKVCVVHSGDVNSYIASEGEVVKSSYEAYDLASGKRLWRKDSSSYNNSVFCVIGHDTLLLGTQDKLTAFRATTGTRLWQFSPGKEISSISQANGMVFVTHQDGVSAFAMEE